MLTTSLVSIIMPSFNSSLFIEDSIKSVLNQSYKNWELIIVDDFSKDNSVEIINSFVQKDSRIIAKYLNKNSGAAIARNIGLNLAKGNYIAFLDSDDLWKPNKLETHIKFMVENNYSMTYSNYELINEKGIKLNKEIKVPSSITYDQYLKNTIIGCLTVVINRDIVGDFHMPNIRTSQDMATWLQILKNGYTAYGIKQSLAYYRLVASSNSSKKIKAAKDVWKVYRDIENLSLFYSCVCFLGYVLNALIKRL